MISDYWAYFIIGLIAWPFVKLLAKVINRAVVEHRRKRFLKLVSVEFPDNTSITFVAVDTSDRRAMRKMQDQLEERFRQTLFTQEEYDAL